MRLTRRAPSMAAQAARALASLATRPDPATELVTLDALAALGESYLRSRAVRGRAVGSPSRRFVTTLVLSSLTTAAATVAVPVTGIAALISHG